MSQVWELKLPQNEAWVLMAMADHANDDGGSIFPGREYVAWKTGYSEDSIKRIFGQLREKGLLIAIEFETGGRGHHTHYEMDLTKGFKKHPFNRDKGVQGCPERGAPTRERGAGDADTPIINHQEPSKNHQSSPGLPGIH